MFDDLMKLVMGASDVDPDYHADRCLAVTQSRAACHRCEDVCPHDAVRVHLRGVTIDEVDCTGCGLCVQECPSLALEPKVRYRPGEPAKCSQVAGDAQTVHCLGRLQPTDLLRLARGRPSLLLARGDCANCPIGTAAIAEAIEHVAGEARELLTLRGKDVELSVEQRDRLDEDATSERMDRRQLLRGGWGSVQRGASDLLAPLDAGGDEAELPAEAQRRYRALELSDLTPEQPVPWPLPKVADGCIMCPTCTRVCPTDAFSRTFSDEDDGAVLTLDPERCVGCDACVSACPVEVISMERHPSWGEVSGGRREAYRRPAGEGPDGTVAREG